jgi:hypothetical protein
MEYIILTASSTSELVQKVQLYISQGWRPLDGVAVAGINSYHAMIRE